MKLKCNEVYNSFMRKCTSSLDVKLRRYNSFVDTHLTYLFRWYHSNFLFSSTNM